jgi:hypothetical protein
MSIEDISDQDYNEESPTTFVIETDQNNNLSPTDNKNTLNNQKEDNNNTLNNQDSV